jgi:hypothetical protein
MSLLFYVNYVNQVGALWIGVWKRYFSTVQGANKTNGKEILVYLYMDEKNVLVASE